MGLVLVGVAASAGTVRYGGVDGFIPLHEGLSAVAGRIGVPLVGLGFVTRVFVKPSRVKDAGLAALVALPGLALLASGLKGYGIAIAALANIGILAACGRVVQGQRAPALAGMAGAALTFVAGLVIGDTGEWAGLLRLDLFHVVLAVANGLLAWSLWTLHR